ncbi:MAG: SUMF1/EgtB/PvdO family nonheme iron enzyme [Planctomycetota bacterium]
MPHATCNRWPRLAATLFFALAAAPGVAAPPGVIDTAPPGARAVPSGDGRWLAPHTVTIPGSGVRFAMQPYPAGDGFGPGWIGRCEVTWGEYRQYMRLCDAFGRFDDAGLRAITDANRVDAVTAPSKLYDPSFTLAAGDAPGLPAVSMSQYAAKQYTKWLSLLTGQFYRLPSGREWEHACRAGAVGRAPSNGGAAWLNRYAWHDGNSDGETKPVGQKLPNAWGLHDMHGNAWEWVLDASAGQAVDPDGPGGEPPVAWPTALHPRALRGGSVMTPPGELSFAALRHSDDASWSSYDPNTPTSPWWFASDAALDVGFRVLRPYHTPPRQRQEVYWRAGVASVERAADLRIDREGRGARGVVDPGLPGALDALRSKRQPGPRH